jgi:hypothetical protein
MILIEDHSKFIIIRIGLGHLTDKEIQKLK